VNTANSFTPPWAEQLFLELRRGRHVLLTGNVGDAYPLEGKFVDATEVARHTLREHGCAVVGVHDIVDGMSFAEVEEQDWFQSRYAATIGNAGRRRPQSPDADTRVREAESGFAEVVTRRNTSREFVAIADALTAARIALGQREQHVGLVFRLAELSFPGGEAPAQDELRPMALLAHVMREAAFLQSDSGIAPRNAIILIAASPSRLLAQYAANEPQVATIEIGLPAVGERRAFLSERAAKFFGADALDDAERTRHAEALVRLTDGLHTWDLEALRRTSFTEQAPMVSPRALTSRFALGRRASPWDETAAAVFSEAYERLSAEVMGQDEVIRAVCSRLMVARWGVGFEDEGGRRQSRPRATFFFAGPTGVGKTELAKALARLLFGDDAALITFDMTEFRDRASAARLTGSDPGFVGFEEGGQLVNAVRARPFSILLFDEIEKAHPSVLDLFIGVLDEGRLTDGHGRTASFADTIVIFTSNAGADRLTAQTGENAETGPDDVRAMFVQAVRDKLTLPPPDGIGRPELFGRMRGGVIGFDFLRRELLDRLTGKFLARWRSNVARVYGVQVEVDHEALFRLVSKRLSKNMLQSGARELEPHLRELLEEPLATLVAAEQLPAGARLVITVDDACTAPRLTVHAATGVVHADSAEIES
jgi:ATP-dependent Clp protease ATP-binding subunit ClpB